MNHDPVTIIGASSAGLYTAYLLARQGVPVRLYEASPELEPQARTLIVTPEFMQALLTVPGSRFQVSGAQPDLGLEDPGLAAGLILNRVRHIALFSRVGHVQVSLPQPDLIIDRSALIRSLAQAAQAAGAELHLGHRFVGLDGDRETRRGGEGGTRGRGASPRPRVTPSLFLRFAKVATGETLTEAASVLVGADGVDSGVAQALGLTPVPTIVNLQAQIVLPDGMAPDTACVWFKAQDTPYFYWLVPEGPDRAVVGLAANSLLRAKERLAGFLNERGWQPLSYQVSRVAAHCPRTRPWARIGESLVYLVGDAAGQVKVTTIGGVVTGLWGARAVAQAIVEGRAYDAALGRARWELDLRWLVRAVLNRFSDDDYDELLGLLNGKTLELLRTYNRDQLTGMWWKLLLAQPRWLPFLGKVLIRALTPRVTPYPRGQMVPVVVEE